jgi:hypothetical protein
MMTDKKKDKMTNSVSWKLDLKEWNQLLFQIMETLMI